MVMNSAIIHQWAPLDILNESNRDFKFVFLILNIPIKCRPEVVVSLWNRAAFRVTVDGGTNIFHEFHLKYAAVLRKDSPELITGDLDSASPEIVSYFKEKKSQVIKTPDQNETDFTKALRQVAKKANADNLKVDGVVALGETFGRFDQVMANINTLFKAEEILHVPVYILASVSLTWLLWPGKHEICINKELMKCWCSLIPVGKPCEHATTTGLKWNLNNQRLEFGHLVSTSNTYSGKEDKVTVETDSPLVWSMEVM